MTMSRDVSVEIIEYGQTVIGAILEIIQFVKENLFDGSIVSDIEKCVQVTKIYRERLNLLVRPYILSYGELEVCCADIENGLYMMEEHLGGLFGEDAPPLEVFYTLRNMCSSKMASFLNWFQSFQGAYECVQNDNIDVPDPVSLDERKRDYMSCPKWILRQLYDTRRAYVHVQPESTGGISTRQKSSDWNAMEQLQMAYDDTIKGFEDELAEKDNMISGLETKIRKLHEALRTVTSQQSGIKIELEKYINLNEEKELQIMDLEGSIRGTREKIIAFTNNLKKRERKQLQTISHLESEVHLLRLALGNDDKLIEIESQLSVIAENQTLEDHVPENSKGQPIVEKISSLDFDDAVPILSNSNIRELLHGALLDSDFAFVDFLGSTFKGKETENLVRYIVQSFEKEDRVHDLLRYLIRQEVEKTQDLSTVFRGENFPARMLRVYSRLIGQQYLHEVLGPIINKIVENDLYLELDPNKLADVEEEVNVEENFMTLRLIAQEVLNRIVESIPNLPLPFVKICHTLAQEAVKRFPTGIQVVVSGFLFLRFFCPCLINPPVFGFPEIEHRHMRSLMMVGKLIQNLANGTEFKEPYLINMNSFLSDNKAILKLYVEKVTKYPLYPDGNSQTLISVERLICDNQEKYPSAPADLLELSWIKPITLSLRTKLYVLYESVSDLGPEIPKDEILNRLDFMREFETFVLRYPTYLRSIVTILNEEDAQIYRESVIESLVLLFAESGKINILIDAVIHTEIAELKQKTTLLSNSCCSTLFRKYCQHFCGQWLFDLWNPFITQILKTRSTLFDNVEELTSVITNLQSQAFENLETCDPTVHYFANSFSSKVLIDFYQFIMINWFAPAIERPDTFHLFRTSLKEEHLPIFSPFKEMLENYANNNETWYKDNKIDQNQIQNFSQIVSEWWMVDLNQNKIEVIVLSEEQKEDSLYELIEFTKKYKINISHDLDNRITEEHIAFNASQLFASLNPEPEEEEHETITELLDLDKSKNKKVRKKNKALRLSGSSSGGLKSSKKLKKERKKSKI